MSTEQKKSDFRPEEHGVGLVERTTVGIITALSHDINMHFLLSAFDIFLDTCWENLGKHQDIFVDHFLYSRYIVERNLILISVGF